jgi:hypothetical protein
MARTPQEDAVQRLDAGLLKQERCSDLFDAAIGTSSEMGAYARLRAAGVRVAAHEHRLHRVRDETTESGQTPPPPCTRS